MDDIAQPVRLPTAKEAPALHGGFWRRVAAYIIDAFAVDAIVYVLWLVLGLTLRLSGYGFNHAVGAPYFDVLAGPYADVWPGGWLGIWYLATIVVIWLYFALFESSRLQATPGKMALGLVVTDEFGRRIGFGRATGRYFAKIISGLILCIGYMMTGWTERKQALHDMLAGTCVVHKFALANLAQESDETPVIAPHRVPAWGVALIVAGAGIFVVAVAAILAAIAIPLYLNYTGRAQVTEAVSAMHKARDILNEYRGKYGGWPTTAGVARFNARIEARAPIGKYTEDVQIVHCAGLTCGILATMRGSITDARLAGKTLELWTTDGGYTWHCGPGGANPADPKALPESCRERGGILL